MRKLLMILLVAISCFLYPLSLNADDSETTETISDEATPESAKRKNYTNNIILLGTGIMVLGGCCYYILNNKDKELSLEVVNKHINDDGSLTLTLAYSNPSKDKLNVLENELSVNKGLAIVLEKNDISKLEPGKHKDVMTIVINEDTDMTWNINGKSISINGNDLINKERGLI